MDSLAFEKLNYQKQIADGKYVLLMFKLPKWSPNIFNSISSHRHCLKDKKKLICLCNEQCIIFCLSKCMTEIEIEKWTDLEIFWQVQDHGWRLDKFGPHRRCWTFGYSNT